MSHLNIPLYELLHETKIVTSLGFFLQYFFSRSHKRFARLRIKVEKMFNTTRLNSTLAGQKSLYIAARTLLASVL